MKYRCLVLDHDDTVVKSTPEIHYPSFVEAMKNLRPNMVPITLEAFVSYCFSPGFLSLCDDLLKLSPDEKAYQYKVWRKYTKAKIPDFYPGFAELLKAYKAVGGIIVVVSHSESEQIIRDYLINCEFAPDLVFGWELEAHQRKPHPYPLHKIMSVYNLKPYELLVVDDLKPGLDMARSCDVPFAAAGWSHIVPKIRDFMKTHSDYYLLTIDALHQLIASE